MSPKTPIIVSRKRERRKQQQAVLLEELLSTSSPIQLLEQAIAVDELHASESILREPLESVRLYDAEQFMEALHYLRAHPPRTDRSPPLPTCALAPIIVSGLLSYAPQQLLSTEDASLTTFSAIGHNGGRLSSPDLVLQFESMRTAAIYRLRHRMRRWNQVCMAILAVSIVLLAIEWSRVRFYWRSRVVAAVSSSCDAMPAYAPACRLAEATVWWKLHFGSSTGSSTKASSISLRLHTALERDLIPWEEVTGEATTSNSDRKDSRKNSDKESVTYKLVLDALLSSFQNKRQAPGQRQHLLDVGCGVGGLSHVVEPHGWTYHGVSASALEIDVARRNSNEENAFFYQQSFDRKLPASNYTAAVAIDSLSFSRHLTHTLQTIVSSLAPGGILIVVDDVIDTNSSMSGTVGMEDDDPGWELLGTHRPSLVSHDHWMTSLAASACKVTSAHDLSSEYQIRMDDEVSFFLKNGRVLTALFAILVDTVLEQMHITSDPQSQRLLELVHELDQVGQYWKLRRHGYESSPLLFYHMYVCVKD